MAKYKNATIALLTDLVRDLMAELETAHEYIDYQEELLEDLEHSLEGSEERNISLHLKQNALRPTDAD